VADLAIPFGRVLRQGVRASEVQGVKRALAREQGVNDPGVGSTLFGATAVADLRLFQRRHSLEVDGVYGPRSHGRLTHWFDDYAFLLYTGEPPHPPSSTVQLPATFTPTHQTAGLPGYPAIDVFAAPGTEALAPADGTVRKLSGHDPHEGGVPGGAYGWSIYLLAARGEYFLTHFGTRSDPIIVGARIWKGQVLGTVCDARVAHMESSLSHIHEGFRWASV